MARRIKARDKIRPAFEGSRDEQDWNEHSQTEVLLAFIEGEAELDPLVAERFQKYLDGRVEEENSGGLPSPSDEMRLFFEAEIENKLSYNQLEPCTLDDAKNSLMQMPDAVLAELVAVDEDDFDRKDFAHEFDEIITCWRPGATLRKILEREKTAFYTCGKCRAGGDEEHFTRTDGENHWLQCPQCDSKNIRPVLPPTEEEHAEGQEG